MTCHQYHSCTPKPRKPPESLWLPAACAFCARWGWEGAGPHWLGTDPSQRARLQSGSLTYLCFICDDCTSFDDTHRHKSRAGHGLKHLHPFYLPQRTPHCPPSSCAYTYKVCSFRETGLIPNIFKDLNKHLQNILKNLCRGNLCVISKPVWFLLLKRYWNS